MLEGLMQNDFPLSVGHIRRRMQDAFPAVAVSTLGEDGLIRSSYGEVAARVDRLGHVLERLGVGPADRVGTFAWNSQQHLELYFAVPCAGAVVHTLNVRLSADQLVYIVNHADDKVVFVDGSLAAQLAPLADRMPGVRAWVVMGETTATLPGALSYEALLAEAPDTPYAWPEVDERAAAALCYTSGTTGNPKGVLYSHRSIALHATSNLFVDGVGMSSRDLVLAAVPMFHVNAWGTPFAAPLCGAGLVFPGRYVQPKPLAGLIESERPTMMNGVPTVFHDLLRHADRERPDLSSLRNAICGGSAVPLALCRGFEERHGVRLFQAWGMTETSPIVTVSRPPAGIEEGSEEYWRRRTAQGRVMPWCELRIVDEAGRTQPAGGAAAGGIEVRGPWIASGYFGAGSADDSFADGWLRTGDVGVVDELAFLQITDRAKDVIKSGGEWISSVELENHLLSHPGVAEAAVVAKPDERWQERPLACVVLDPDSEVTAEGLTAHLSERVVRWWLPDEYAFIDEVPKTGTGKFDKKELRRRLADGELGNRVAATLADPAR